MTKYLFFVISVLWLVGCTNEPGRIRISLNDAIGVYQSKFGNGQERLELRRDGSYLQEFVSKTRSFKHTGTWHIENHLFDGTDILLVNAIVGEDDEKVPFAKGDRRLNVHNNSGKIALARNEVMDFYYERVR